MDITTYILKDKKLKIRDLNSIDKDFFVEISHLEKLNPRNLDYDTLEGAISIVVDNQEYMGFRYYDEINALWRYFVTALSEVIKSKESEFKFPDQPLPVKLKIVDKNILFSINGKQKFFEAEIFIKKMLEAAIDFFNALHQLFPKLQYEIKLELNKINSILNNLNLNV